MELQQYVTRTWVTALLIHPIFFFVFTAYVDQSWDWELLPVAAIMGLFFSLPAYVLCLLSARMLLGSPLSLPWKLAVWAFCVLLNILAGFALIVYLFFGTIAINDLLLVSIPGCAAALLAIALQYTAFTRTIHTILLRYEDALFETEPERII